MTHSFVAYPMALAFLIQGHATALRLNQRTTRSSPTLPGHPITAMTSAPFCRADTTDLCDVAHCMEEGWLGDGPWWQNSECQSTCSVFFGCVVSCGSTNDCPFGYECEGNTCQRICAPDDNNRRRTFSDSCSEISERRPVSPGDDHSLCGASSWHVEFRRHCETSCHDVHRCQVRCTRSADCPLGHSCAAGVCKSCSSFTTLKTCPARCTWTGSTCAATCAADHPSEDCASWMCGEEMKNMYEPL